VYVRKKEREGSLLLFRGVKTSTNSQNKETEESEV